MIISWKILLVLIVMAGIGYAVLYKIANRKWGYTPKREKELEKADDVSGNMRK